MLRVKCSGCGGCCTKSIVPVTDSDVKRLMKRTGKSAEEIVRFYDSDVIDYSSDAPSWIKLNYGKRIIGLKKKNDHCLFLDDNNRCTVYSDRPATCRTFPLQVYMGDNGQIKNIALNRIIKNTYKTGNKQPVTKIIRTAVMEEREDERYFSKINKWNNRNSRPGKQEFLNFLKLSN